MIKKHFSFLGILISILAIAIGTSCSGSGSEDSEQTIVDGEYGKHDINITIWAPEALCNTFAGQAKAFVGLVSSTWDIGFRVQAVGEDVLPSHMMTDVEAGADIFCFTHENSTQLFQVGALSTVGDSFVESLVERNDEISIAASKVNGKMCAFPLTSDNGYFMYYDKSVFPNQEDGSVNANLENMEDIIATLKAAGDKKIYFELSHGWYNASYFYGAGCHSEWAINDKGAFISYDDTYNSEEGRYALMETYELMSEDNIFVSSSDGASAFNSGAAICVSGTWNSADVQRALGDDFGATDLPSVTDSRGEKYHLSSYAGCKLIGCKKQEDSTTGLICQTLADFLTNEDNQLERYQKHGWGPSNKNVQQSDAVKEDVALNALRLQNLYAVPQGQYPTDWWNLSNALPSSYWDSKNHDLAAATSILEEYEGALPAYLDA